MTRHRRSKVPDTFWTTKRKFKKPIAHQQLSPDEAHDLIKECELAILERYGVPQEAIENFAFLCARTAVTPFELVCNELNRRHGPSDLQGSVQSIFHDECYVVYFKDGRKEIFWDVHDIESVGGSVLMRPKALILYHCEQPEVVPRVFNRVTYILDGIRSYDFHGIEYMKEKQS